jgi:hypothetical protein
VKFAELYTEAILWTCWLENYPDPARFLNIYGLEDHERLLFDCMGRFFPFDEFYSRIDCNDPRAINDLRVSKKTLILPWIYRPVTSLKVQYGKHIICPTSEMFDLLDNKVETKRLFKKLGIPTPEWTFNKKGVTMLEKPVCNSSLGLGIRLTDDNPRDGYYLEESLPSCSSFGLQFFVYDEAEFICATEMLYHSHGEKNFTFHSQTNVKQDKLPQTLVADCFKVIEYLQDKGYRGLINIDALVDDGTHHLLEINPRGSAFLPVFFAASAIGWTNFITHMKDGSSENEEITLLDFGRLKKIIRKIQ